MVSISLSHGSAVLFLIDNNELLVTKQSTAD